MDETRTAAFLKQPERSHLAFGAVWTLLLIAAGCLVQGSSLPWLPWILGWTPAAAGLAAFLAWPKARAARWIVLLAGETLGVLLGSVLLAGPHPPLLVLLLWPIGWTALVLPFHTGLALLGGTALAYLVGGLLQIGRSEHPGSAVLGVLLYLAAFGAAFFLLHLLTRPSAAEEEIKPPAEQTSSAPAEALPANPTEVRAPAGVAPVPPPTDDEALHQDLRVARDIQVSLLLASSPRLPGWEASTSFLPARQLGGDLYDFVELDALHRGVMIGDVTGKGIPAALHMAVARTIFRIQARQFSRPGETLDQLNRSLIEQIPQGCVTLLYAHVNVSDGTLCLANAGHNYPILLDDAVQELALDGLPLGIDEDYHYQELSIQMKPGDVLILYTDGVVEAMDPQGALFGFERLQDLLANGAIHRPRTLTRQIVRAVRGFTGPTPQSDDITLVVLRRRYKDPTREMGEISRDVLGLEGSELVQERLESMQIPSDAPAEEWRAAILSLGSLVSERWGQGPSRELMQQLFLALENY